MKLQGKTAIITGGSRGIGKTIAEFFVREGANVLIAARSEQELIAVQTDLAKTAADAKNGARVEICVTDVAKKIDAKALVKKAIDCFETFDILVNAAGVYGAIGTVAEVDFEKWKTAFDINLFGTVNVIQEVLPVFMEKKQGRIINFSGGGDGAFPHFSAYSSSKIAVVRFTETLAEEIKEYGITVNAIAPGAVNTKFLDEALKAGADRVGKDFYEKLKKQKDEGGVGPDKAAELCVFLASGESGVLSGKMISAVWDDWKSWDAGKVKELMDSPKLNIRRTPYR
jgi:NAD(P)-dependent dehydrogenase (short-subunit alcohol dehydrogenase family)